MGAKAAVSSSVLDRLKYWVAAVSPPVRMPRASLMVILVSEFRKICLALGAACSAARFIPISSSSTCAPMPIIRMVLPADCSLGGSRILMAAFLRYPSGRPVETTALPVLTRKASLRPAVILSSLSPWLSCGVPSAASALFLSSSSGDCARHAPASTTSDTATRKSFFIRDPPKHQSIAARTGAGKDSLEHGLMAKHTYHGAR